MGSGIKFPTNCTGVSSYRCKLGLRFQTMILFASGVGPSASRRETLMKKTILALATTALLAVATLSPSPADARCRGCGIGLGILGGFVAGAAIASAARPAYAYPAY